MTTGRLIAVVGASGVGKDSVMAGIAAARSDLSMARRSITRAPRLGGEVYDALTPQAFEAAVLARAFCLHWQAHGLRYGIPATVLGDVRAGARCLANLSRSVLAEADALFPALTVLNITARPETLKARLLDRGRETSAGILQRLARTGAPMPLGLDIVDVPNDGPLTDAVETALRVLSLRNTQDYAPPMERLK